MAYKQMSTPVAKRRAVEVKVEKDRTRTKQSKVNSSWLKAAKNKLIKAFGNTNMPFTVVDSVYTNPLLETIREVGPNVRAPSSYELSDDIFLIPNICIDKVKIGKTESVDQQPQDMQGSDCESEGHLSPSSCHGGSEGEGDGGNGGANEMGTSYSSRQSIDYFIDHGCGVTVEDDRRSRRSPDEQPREPTQTYRRIRKGKEPVQPHDYPTDAMYGYAGFQEVPSSFTGPSLFAPSGGYDTYGVQQILIALHRLILHMSHNLLGLIQVDDIQTALRSLTRELLIMGIIIIISLPFIAIIQLQIQQPYQCSTHNNSHMVLIRTMMIPIRILPVIHFGGDKFLCIMDFRYEFVPNVQ
ncbi:hypothetical protein Cgig2_021333 [Carnegiea gigantea]|uniref:Uncharacterized protein n=1 Tax=Carnegiea gigantea TaxID=171969 RepID=A0A9Q1GW07_9CARY|nr:hypothetical protein Cgig2_021333 [Carnegiea gigantea]